MRFAYEVVKMSSDLIDSGMGRPELPKGGVPAAIETFRAMSYGQHNGLFDYADFAEVYIYS